jgi:hypothetical protein
MKKKDSRFNKHHFIPYSRHKKPETVIIPKKDHIAYHVLFENMLPEEIICYLVVRYWRGDWSFVERALEREWGLNKPSNP